MNAKHAKPTNDGMWKDAFYYLHKHSGASDERVRGVIIGVTSGLMAFGVSFESVMSMLKSYVENHPEAGEFRPVTDLLPECWIEAYRKA